MRTWCLSLTIVAIACVQVPTFAQNKEALKAAAMQAELLKKAMAKFDLNDDGEVDDEEKAKVIEKVQADIADGKIPAGFKELLDRNRNGKLEPQEAAMFREIVGRLQAGGGPPQFGAGDAQPGFGGPGFGGPGFGNQGGDPFSGQIPPAILKKFDKDKDGQLDEAEKKAAMAAFGPKKSRKEQLLEKLDLNGDGKVTKEERAEVAAQRKAELEEKKAEAAEKKAQAKKKFDKDDDVKDEDDKAEKDDKKKEKDDTEAEDEK